jgi:excinuclease UvrABC ATPase subunit
MKVKQEEPLAYPDYGSISIRGARENNLKNVSLDIPKRRITVFVDTLIGLFDRMVEAGSSVIVIEHNLDVIARADWVIDLGPGAGQEGGTVQFEGVPVDLAKNGKTLTGRYLSQRRGAR